MTPEARMAFMLPNIFSFVGVVKRSGCSRSTIMFRSNDFSSNSMLVPSLRNHSDVYHGMQTSGNNSSITPRKIQIKKSIIQGTRTNKTKISVGEYTNNA